MASRAGWLRFTFDTGAEGEFGRFGRILANLCGEKRALYFDPVPDQPRFCLYLADSEDNKARVIELAREAELRPVGFDAVETLPV